MSADEELVVAREALSRRDWDDAYRRFLSASAATPLAGVDLEGQAEAARWSSRFGEVIEILERAEAAYLASEDACGAARAALKLAIEHHTRANLSVAMGCALRARTLLGEHVSESPEHALLSWCLGRGAMQRGDYATAREHLETAAAIARRQGNRDIDALSKHDLGHIAIAEGLPAEGQALVDEAVALAMSGAVGLQASGMIYCGTIWACRNRGDYQRAAEWTEVSTRWCAREAVSGFPGLCRVHRAEILRLHGDFASAESEAQVAVTELLAANRQMAGFAWRELGDARLRRGELEGAAEAYRETIVLGTDPQPGLALLRLREGNPAAARRALQPALSNDQHLVRTNQAHLLPAWITIVLACGDQATARSAVAEMDALAESLGTAPMAASAACARGELALAEKRFEAAMTELLRAWQIWCDNDLPYEAAHARMLLADVHLGANDPEAAALELETARQVFERLGALRDVQRVMERLTSLSSPRGGHEEAERRVRETLMFTDIVGSTALVEAMGDDAWGFLRLWHDRALRACIAQHGGEEVDHTGDGFFVAFASASDALGCAVEIQRTLAAHRREHGFAPQVRIGVHAAEVSQRATDRTGRGIHEAARIAAAAGGGEIFVSCATLREADVELACSPPRALTLKGLSAPMDVVAVDWSASPTRSA